MRVARWPTIPVIRTDQPRRDARPVEIRLDASAASRRRRPPADLEVERVRSPLVAFDGLLATVPTMVDQPALDGLAERR